MIAKREYGKGKNPERLVTIEYPLCRTHWSEKFSKTRKPDRFVDGQGYVKIRVNGRLRHEHRVVMEQKLGRPLQKGERVLWKDGDRTNNDPENLVLYGVIG
jgi:hypothetical protein